MAEKLNELEIEGVDIQQRLERELKRDYHIVTATSRLDQMVYTTKEQDYPLSNMKKMRFQISLKEYFFTYIGRTSNCHRPSMEEELWGGTHGLRNYAYGA